MEKMIAFFREHSSFINCREPKSGNTALHNAARSGHFVSFVLLDYKRCTEKKNLIAIQYYHFIENLT